jgi:hypothetical protein
LFAHGKKKPTKKEKMIEPALIDVVAEEMNRISVPKETMKTVEPDQDTITIFIDGSAVKR